MADLGSVASGNRGALIEFIHYVYYLGCSVVAVGCLAPIEGGGGATGSTRRRIYGFGAGGSWGTHTTGALCAHGVLHAGAALRDRMRSGWWQFG